MKLKFTLLVLGIVMCLTNQLNAQTVLISPTGDGGFETGTTLTANGWTIKNDTENKWYVGTASVASGTRGAYIDRNSSAGTAANYNGASGRTSHFYRDVAIPADATAITLTFSLKGSGEIGYDRLLVYRAPTTVTPVAGTPAPASTTIAGATLIYTQTAFLNGFATQTIPLPVSLAGTTVRLIFTWQNDDNTSTAPSAAIDNISLTYTPPSATITTFLPTNACFAATQNVVITGTNFTGATAVKFGTVNATSFTVNSATQITAVMPVTLPANNYVLSVTTPAGPGYSVSSFMVNALPNAAISYSGSPYCSNTGIASATQTGTGGGTYSSTTGLSINNLTGAITTTTSTPGTYTVTYSFSNGTCANTTTTSVVINPAPTATVSYPNPSYCTSGGTVNATKSGIGTGTYSALPAGLSINATTGAINLAASTPNIYVVTYTIAATGGCSLYTTTTGITVLAAPAAPSTITGNTIPCINTTGNTYDITAVAGAISYNWTYGGIGATITNGNTTNPTIDFAAGATSGTLSVTASNGICSSTAATLPITITSAPAAPGTVTGAVAFCEATTQAYSFAAVPGATSYTWGYTGAGATYNATTTTANNSYAFATGATSGNLTVTANNTCGTSTAKTVALTINYPPATPAAASGLVFGTSTAASVTGSFTASGASGYLVIRSVGAFSGVLVNGTPYAAGAAIGNGTILQSAAATTFAETGLTSNTTYTYTVYAYNTGICTTPIYSTSPVASTVTTCAAAPTALVTSAVNQISFNLAWTASNAGGNAFPITYTVEVSTNNTFTANLATYNPSASQSGTSISIAGLNAATTYYYRVNASNGVCVSVATGSQLTSPAPVAAITTAHPNGGNINQNTINTPIAAFKIVATNAAVTPASLSITTAGTYAAGTDISAFKVYQNATNTLTGAIQVGTITAAASGTIHNITLTATPIAATATSYLIITADAPNSALNGKTVYLNTTALSGFTFNSISPVTNSGAANLGASNLQTIVGPQANVTQAQPAAIALGLSSADNVIAAYKIDAINSAVIPATIKLTTGGTYVAGDITQFNVYQNSTNNLNGSPVLVATVNTVAGSGAVLTFTGSFVAVAVGTPSYLVITADVDPAATINNTVSITVTPITNFTFTTATAAGVAVGGTPTIIIASNTHTIKGAQITVTATHPAAGIITQNTTENVLATWKLDDLYQATSPAGIAFATTGTYIAGTDITQFELYQNSSNTIVGATLIGSVTATASGTTMVITGTGNPIALGGSSYLFLTADLPLTATNGNTVRISATALANFAFADINGNPAIVVGANPATIANIKTIAGPRVTVTTAHPATGNITTGSVDNQVATYVLTASNVSGTVTPTSVTLTTAPASTATATDLINYKIYQNVANTLAGATLVSTVAAPGAGANVTFSGAFVSLPNAGVSYLIVTTDVRPTAALGNTVRFATTALSNFVFSSSTGGVVAKLGSDPANNSNVKTIAAPGAAITTVHPSASNMAVGSIDNLIAAYKIDVTNAAITPTSVTLTSTGTNTGAADILNYKIYQNNTNSLTGATLVGTVTNPGAPSADNLVFNAGPFVTIPAATTGYILVVADIAGTATPNRTLGVSNAAATAKFSFSSIGIVNVTGGTLAASPLHNILLKIGVYWTGTGNWNNTTGNWGSSPNGGTPNPYLNSVWIANGIANLEKTAGTITVTDVVKAQHISNPAINNFIINANNATNGVTLTSPAKVTIGTGTTFMGNAGTNPVIYGINGLTKLGAGELSIGTRFGTTFSGPLNINEGELTLGLKASNTSTPYNVLRGNAIILNNAKLTIATVDGDDGSLRSLTSFTSSGNATLSLYKTRATNATFPYMNVLFSNDANTFGTGANGSPLSISGTLNVDGGGSTFTNGTFVTGGSIGIYQNTVAFGSTTYTGNTTFRGFAAGNAQISGNVGTHVNINLGGYGHYLTGVSQAIGTINDNGFTTTFYGGGNAAQEGAELNFNSANSTMTGNWIIGDEAGQDAGWLVTNTTTCLTRGTVNINNYSKLCLQLTSGNNVNITYSPSVINVSGLGPDTRWPSALDFYNFQPTAGLTTIPSDIVLNTTSNSKLAGIGSQVGGSNANVVFQVNGEISGAAGLEKTGPGILALNAQNGSGKYNTYADTTRIKDGTFTVNAGSNMGTGALHMFQINGVSTAINLNNTDQTVASLTSTFTNTSGESQILTLNGTTLTVNQAATTSFGDPATGTSTANITGTGSLVKDGAGTLTLTGQNTYTGLTQIKGGVLRLNNTGGATLATGDIHIVDGKLQVSTVQTVNNLILSKGVLQLDANMIVNNTFTIVDGSIAGTGTITYASTGAVIYAGSIPQTTSTKELPATSGPRSVTFSNYNEAGVKLNASIPLSSGTVENNGWLDLNGKTISGTVTPFTLNGLTGYTLAGTTTSGSTIVKNIVTANIKVGMQVTGAGVPDKATVIYIDPLAPKTIILNTAATATATTALTFAYRGGLIVTATGGVSGHITVSGTKTYKPGANFRFGVPAANGQIYPALPPKVTGVNITYPYAAWDVIMDAGSPQNHVVLGAGASLNIDHNLTLTGGVLATGDNLITYNNANGGTFTYPAFGVAGTAFTKSWIATCQFNAAPATVGVPFNGGVGFRYNLTDLTHDNYFPVGADFTSPNRMMVNLEGALARNITVVVGKGDIGNTGETDHPAPRVNRIWYVKSSISDSIHATMKLYYTHHPVGSYPSLQDELETGWIGSHTRLVQKQNLSDNKFINVSNASEQANFPAASNNEYFALLRPNADTGFGGKKTGIYTFSYFSIVDGDGLGVVLPVTFTAVKAYKEGSGVNVDWAVANEINIDHYELQRAGDGSLFTNIGTIAARNTGSGAAGNYTLPDALPLTGTNYYRVKAVGKDGQISYTNIVNVTLSGDGKTSMLIYPNPVTNSQFTLKLTNLPAGKYSMTVTSIGGAQVLVKAIEHLGGSASQKVYLPAGLAAGIYSVQLASDKTTMRTNIYVNN